MAGSAGTLGMVATLIAGISIPVQSYAGIWVTTA
jgi:hypothetical protein